MADAYSDITIEYATTPTNPIRLAPSSKDGKKKVWTYTQSGTLAQNGTVGLFVLRANEVLDTHHMSVAYSAVGAGRTLNIGHDGYTLPDGTVVAPAPTAIAQGIDVSAAGRTVVRDAPTSPVDSFGPIAVDTIVVAQIAGNTMPDGNTVNGSAEVGQP